MLNVIRICLSYWRHLVLVRPVRPSQNPIGAESRQNDSKAAMQVNMTFVCGVRFTSGQLITELFPDSLKVMLFALCFMSQGQ